MPDAPRPDPAATEGAIDAAFLQPLPILLAVAGFLTVATAPWTVGVIPGGDGHALAWMYAFLGLCVLALGWWLWQARPDATLAYAAVSLVALTFTVADLAYVRLGDAIQFNSELWLLMGSGFVLLRTRWLHAVLLTTAALWLALFGDHLADPRVQQYGFQVLAGIAFGYLAHALRRHGLKRIAAMGRSEREARDLAETTLAESRAAEQRLRTLTETAPLGIFQTDARGAVVYANQRWCDIAGCDYHDFDRIRRAVHPDDLERMRTTWRAAMAAGSDLTASFRYVHADGQVRDVTTRATPLRAADGTVEGYVGTLEDVSVLRRAEAEARRTASEYRALAENSPDLVTRFDHLHRRLFVNRSTEVARGLPRDRLLGRPPDAQTMPGWPPAAIASLRAALERGFATGAIQTVDVETDGPGPARSVEVRVVPEFDDQGAVATVLALMRDVTEHRRQEHALQRSEEMFRALLESAPDAMVIVDEAGSIRLVNSQAEAMFGYARAEMLSRPIEALIPSEFARGHAAKREHYTKHAKPRPMGVGLELYGQRKDGSRFPVEVSLGPIETEQGLLICAAVRDITVRKEAAQADRVAFERLLEIEQLKEMDRFKTRILNTASHELNTPITPLKLQLHLLASGRFGPLTPQQQHSAAILTRNVERLASLVGEILDVARLQSGRLRLHPQELDVAQVVQEAADAFAEPARTAGVALKVRRTGDLHARADAQRLSQVLDNLLSNALKFTPAGGAIEVEAGRQGADVEVRVRDTGLGLDAQQIKRLFQPFSQVHDATRIQRPGTGLGLYICRGIVTEHGGTLDVVSEGAGHGSTFWFRLPVAGPPPKPQQDEPGQATGAAAA